jgi:hypothetical protein
LEVQVLVPTLVVYQFGMHIMTTIQVLVTGDHLVVGLSQLLSNILEIQLYVVWVLI